MRRVISLWLPRFATDLLQRRSSDLRDEALVTTVELKSALRIAAANAAASRLANARIGQALADARAAYPPLKAVPADPARERRALRALVRWANRYSPWVAPDPASPAGGDSANTNEKLGGDAGLWLDVTGCAHLFGGETALMREMTDRLRQAGFAARTAAAPTPGAAWALARHAPSEAVPVSLAPTEIETDDIETALAPLPVRALRLAPDTVSGLTALGLRQIGDLTPLPRAALADRFGDEVAYRLDQAMGRAPEAISPVPIPVRNVVRHGFAEPVGRTDDIAEAARLLLDRLCARLETQGLGARRIELTLEEPDGSKRHVAAGTSRPSRDAAHLMRLLAEPLTELEAAFGVDAVVLAAPVVEPLGAIQNDSALGPDASGAADMSPEAAAALIDRLSNRLGAGNVLRLLPHESHIPERAVRPRPALEGAPKRRAADPSGRDAVWCDLPRPVRLLSPPEEIEAMAPVPDDPPVMFRWRRLLHRIARAEGPERLSPEWWRAAGDPRQAAATTRDYYRVEDEDGGRFWLYREGLYGVAESPLNNSEDDESPPPPVAVTPRWYLHGILG